MIYPQTFETLERLVSRLPFHLDNIDEANALFDSWRKNRRREEQNIIDLWTYCFVWRNVLLKFSRDPDLNPSDFDMLVARIFERIVDRRHTIREKDRYASWISVVCRNSFINHVRVRKKNVQVREEDWQGWYISEPKVAAGDGALLLQVLSRAIARLPGYLRAAAHMRLVEELTYDEISDITGKKVEVVRAYVNKALRRLRNDQQLRVFLEKEFREDP